MKYVEAWKFVLPPERRRSAVASGVAFDEALVAVIVVVVAVGVDAAGRRVVAVLADGHAGRADAGRVD